MSDYFAIMNKIDAIIEEINLTLGSELAINMDDPSGEQFPTMGQRGEWNHNIKRLVHEFIHAFCKNPNLFKFEDLSNLLNYFVELNTKLNKAFIALNNATIENYQTINNELEEVKAYITNSIEINSLNFEYKEGFNQDDILSLYESIKRVLQDFDVNGEVLTFITNTEDNDKKVYLLKSLIDLYNLQLESSNYLSGRKTEKLMQEIEKLIQPSNREKVTQLVNETNEMVVHVKENLGLSKNEKLLMIFNNEAKELGEKIERL